MHILVDYYRRKEEELNDKNQVGGSKVPFQPSYYSIQYFVFQLFSKNSSHLNTAVLSVRVSKGKEHLKKKGIHAKKGNFNFLNFTAKGINKGFKVTFPIAFLVFVISIVIYIQ